ncbi:MAG: hypothetical protein HFH34_09225 [Eubacterium sp.]|nr:hypothetical protein [Eubacterium sp.]
MRIAGNTFSEFDAVSSKKKVVAYGAADFLRVISQNFQELKLDEKIQYVLDSDKSKEGTRIFLKDTEKKIYAPDQLEKENPDEILILIASSVYAYEIFEQLNQNTKLNNTDCFILSLMIGWHEEIQEIPHRKKEDMDKIPKKIHCFWFSKEKKTALAVKCMESWKRICPDYEIIEWNTDSYDVTANPYMYQAYQERNWAYVSDYARLDVIYRYGGIYLDLDVLLIKSPDLLLKHDFFVGFDYYRGIEAAAFGAKQGCSVVKEMLDIYKNKSFDPDTGTSLLNLQPMYLDHFFAQKGYQINGKYQDKDDIVIYPKEVFSARNIFTMEDYIKPETIGIHCCVSGWLSEKRKEMKQKKIDGSKQLQKLYFG